VVSEQTAPACRRFRTRHPAGDASRFGAVLSALVLAGAWGQGADIPNADCLICHEDQTLTKTNAQGAVKLLYLDAAKLGASVHKSNA